MKVLNLYRTLNNANNNAVTLNNVSMIELSESAKEYKGFFIQGNYIIKDRVIITEVVKPSTDWIDNFLDKASKLTEGRRHFAYTRPAKALEEGARLLEQFNL
ncbi:hypothetical protein VP277E431_P0144 [Vibrio phage 277E43-1]|nr:hypothetical protein VP277E431_P0144 [Vibrio phage 277E43-1]